MTIFIQGSEECVPPILSGTFSINLHFIQILHVKPENLPSMCFWNQYFNFFHQPFRKKHTFFPHFPQTGFKYTVNQQYMKHYFPYIFTNIKRHIFWQFKYIFLKITPIISATFRCNQLSIGTLAQIPKNTIPYTFTDVSQLTIFW